MKKLDNDEDDINILLLYSDVSTTMEVYVWNSYYTIVSDVFLDIIEFNQTYLNKIAMKNEVLLMILI